MLRSVKTRELEASENPLVIGAESRSARDLSLCIITVNGEIGNDLACVKSASMRKAREGTVNWRLEKKETNEEEEAREKDRAGKDEVWLAEAPVKPAAPPPLHHPALMLSSGVIGRAAWRDCIDNFPACKAQSIPRGAQQQVEAKSPDEVLIQPAEVQTTAHTCLLLSILLGARWERK
ncbi:hypothetical protein EYF80_005645 [Liparis tanakae]|uniref:Uncharacterized protein n=1 Tax=Liparis tanakae TaxID=230148 RepID=A0A4Z2J1D7_9TELE|nr:hypothetical protein EYF80_005645 [Liparis tanakae]